MVAPPCPKFIRATVRCIASVDFPVPPFSLPTTMTCAETERLALTCINMPSTRYGRPPGGGSLDLEQSGEPETTLLPAGTRSDFATARLERFHIDREQKPL